jgi:signal transduction histidine kinase
MANKINADLAASLTPVREPQPLELTPIGRRADTRRPEASRQWLAGLVAVAAIAGAVLAAALPSSASIGPGQVLSAVLVAVWAGCALFVARRRPDEPLALIMAVGALSAAIAVLGAVLLGRSPGSDARDVTAAARALGLAFLPAIGLHLGLGLPDGRLHSPPRRATVGLTYAAALVVGTLAFADRPHLPLVGVLSVAGWCAVAAVGGFATRCRSASLTQRPRLQWPAWGVTVALGTALAAAVLNLLLDWPSPILAISVGATVLVPLALAVAVSGEVAVRIDRLLVHTITLAGLFALVGASYLLVIVGLGRTPTGNERSLLGLSILAAAVAALLWVPARERLADLATRRVYGERHAPDEVLRTFGSRLTRALPLDELLLQLAESLQKTMALDTAEVWTRAAGERFERVVSVPERGPAALAVRAAEEQVIARAGVVGPAWAQVWLPALVSPDGEEPVLRIVPVTNSGELLGLIVVTRPDGAAIFDEADDQALTELARQVGLALHNVRLDSALQESLDEVRRQADELRASRARIVEAGDAQRRSIERDLHDGAQQHLVALAVSVRLARQIVESDPAQALVMLDQIRVDVQDTVQELRNLAHGIYPPLLAARGLPEALSAAGGRAALATTVNAEGVGRYPQPTEAAVYFCVLEAIQNAGKHAGDGAEITVSIHEEEGALLFEVADDGAGFDLASGAHRGQGFMNMADRVGAIGGTVTVDTAPRQGTRIAGRIPLLAAREAG